MWDNEILCVTGIQLIQSNKRKREVELRKMKKERIHQIYRFIFSSL